MEKMGGTGTERRDSESPSVKVLHWILLLVFARQKDSC